MNLGMMLSERKKLNSLIGEEEMFPPVGWLMHKYEFLDQLKCVVLFKILINRSKYP